MGDWQTIDTAPKDGSLVLLGGCKSGPRVRLGYWGSGRYNRSTKQYEKDWTTGPSDRGFEPSHWMPLPASPETPEQGKGK